MASVRDDTASPVDFVTLGMFIIDDIYPPPSASHLPPQKDVIGGAGTYSAVGARLFSPSPYQSQSVGWIVDAGTDFPAPVQQLISSWQTACLMRERQGLTTRGWNGYGENEYRAFKYLTPKLRLTADDLPKHLLASSSFHLISSPSRCIDIVRRIVERRKAELGENFRQPLFVWEPVPDRCVASEYDNTLEACKYVDVISPNHEELSALMSEWRGGSGSDWKTEIASLSRKLLVNERIAVVVRCGKEGAYYTRLAETDNSQPVDESLVEDGWLPAYYGQDPTNVVDPTGGGNGFLGGLSVGLVRNKNNLREAVAWGNVAASFCIEQVGVPKVTSNPNDGVETWNGHSVGQRLNAYRVDVGTST